MHYRKDNVMGFGLCITQVDWHVEEGPKTKAGGVQTLECRGCTDVL